ncbi:MAG: hypothetical protein JXB50_16415 [Spirochaetes bacterium]|nr:hypothetical protein [Spirochaetota bacterium]
MTEEKLYIIYGIGSDSVGLVGKITSPIAEVNGNIVDLRQDVLHGLFTIYLVVDLKDVKIGIEVFKKKVNEISEKTGIDLFMDKYTPVPRDPEKKNLLLVLIGIDKPGIASKVSETLSKYEINIEFSKLVAREEVFLMELLTDISKSTIPVSNLEKTLKEIMLDMGIYTQFQTKDVFNKKKRLIVFNLIQSFISQEVAAEIVKQIPLTKEDMKSMENKRIIELYLENAVANLDGLPVDVINNIVNSITFTPGTIELLQTLKIMGYRILLISPAVNQLLDFLRKKLDIDYFYGFELPINEDTKLITKDINIKELVLPDIDTAINEFAKKEEIEKSDITIISDKDVNFADNPGIKVNFNLKVILDYFNQHILSKENILGLLTIFGIPKELK